MGINTSEVFEKPKETKTKSGRERRRKSPKSRLHIYVNDDTIDSIDQKAAEMGVNRSAAVQVLLSFALQNLNIKNH